MLHTLAISNYRSIRELALPFGALTVVSGANGVGKSSLYRCLRLLADTARGQLVGGLAREGGLRSTLWAGPEVISKGMRQRGQVQGTVRKHPVRLRLGFQSDDFGFAIELGLPSPSANAFALDPEIKREVVWVGPELNRRTTLVDRRRNIVQFAGEAGLSEGASAVPLHESVLTHVADPRRAPELMVLRERLRGWRFYDHLRSDRDAPARRPQIGTWTPTMAHDGSDLAAAVATLFAMEGREAVFDRAVADAFPGAKVRVRGETAMEVVVEQPGMLRPLAAAELSDGTLRYLMLVAALQSVAPPELLVLNEPETSLHADLIPALGRLILEAATRSQVWVVTHSRALVAALGADADIEQHVLDKDMGETVLLGQTLLTTPRWTWPAR
ncbi:ATPase-like protein [Plesiocystis pacifica SIR-1]|uniref:ATPase-like protein n=1 Tax=Plesiocystis pacifica SIR-1 TaxID=391625 RepID=A6G4D1_9BACT|nr:AAA family ATPase [Plesiocystis pacifica]EDM79243.1 ATPase-like protein [Plesiocystis pacifica SIR-1]